jgi:hypothetical protein
MNAMPNSSGRSRRQARRATNRVAEYLCQMKFTASPETRKISGMRHWFDSSIGSCSHSDRWADLTCQSQPAT